MEKQRGGWKYFVAIGGLSIVSALGLRASIGDEYQTPRVSLEGSRNCNAKPNFNLRINRIDATPLIVKLENENGDSLLVTPLTNSQTHIYEVRLNTLYLPLRNGRKFYFNDKNPITVSVYHDIIGDQKMPPKKAETVRESTNSSVSSELLSFNYQSENPYDTDEAEAIINNSPSLSRLALSCTF